MKRLYFRTSSIDRAEKAYKDIHREGVSNWNFHIMSRDKDGLTKHHLHSTNTLVHERDVIRIGERGAIIGVIIGICAAFSFLNIASFLPVRLIAQALVLFACIALGLAGAFMGGLIGLAMENAKIRLFHDDLEAGCYLLMVDVRQKDVAQIAKVMSRHKDLLSVGEGSSIISPFQLPVKALKPVKCELPIYAAFAS